MVPSMVKTIIGKERTTTCKKGVLMNGN